MRLACALLLAAGCGPIAPLLDAGVVDASAMDIERRVLPRDAGVPEAGQPELGACCLLEGETTTGVCEQAREEDCLEGERRWSAQPCGIACPDHRRGACCDPELGTCSTTHVGSCMGMHAGPGTVCPDACLPR